MIEQIDHAAAARRRMACEGLRQHERRPQADLHVAVPALPRRRQRLITFEDRGVVDQRIERARARLRRDPPGPPFPPRCADPPRRRAPAPAASGPNSDGWRPSAMPGQIADNAGADASGRPSHQNHPAGVVHAPTMDGARTLGAQAAAASFQRPKKLGCRRTRLHGRSKRLLTDT